MFAICCFTAASFASRAAISSTNSYSLLSGVDSGCSLAYTDEVSVSVLVSSFDSSSSLSSSSPLDSTDSFTGDFYFYSPGFILTASSFFSFTKTL